MNVLHLTSAVAMASLALLVSPGQSQAGDIAIGQINDKKHFLLNGQIFIPRGVNYDPVGYDNAGVSTQYHGLFDPCLGGRSYPACYGDGSVQEGDLRYIHGSNSSSVFNYNYIRVFIDSVYVNDGFTYRATSKPQIYWAGPGVAPTNTIPGDWLSNVADFLQRAHNNGLRVVLTGEYAPGNFSFTDLTCIQDGISYTPCATVKNKVLFDPDYGRALGNFYAQIVASLNSPPYSTTWPNAASAIMGFDIQNELQVLSTEMPLTNISGNNAVFNHLQIDNGVYDLTSFGPTGSRQALLDDLTKNFAVSVGSAVRASDPSHSILVTASVTTPYDNNNEPGYTGADGSICKTGAACSFPMRAAILMFYGNVDFGDIHSYALAGHTDSDSWSTAGLTTQASPPVPLIMGEFGAPSRSMENPGTVYNDEQSAVTAMQQHLIASCAYGFQGWGLWTWKPSNPSTYDQVWPAIFTNPNGTENNGVNGGLSIQGFPHIC